MNRRLPLLLMILWILFMAVATAMPLDSFFGGPWEWLLINDWIAHVVLFAVLAVLAMMMMRANYRQRALRTLVGGLVFGVLIELVQAALPWERGAQWSDVVADGMGLLLGLVIYVVVKRVRPATTAARARR